MREDLLLSLYQGSLLLLAEAHCLKCLPRKQICIFRLPAQGLCGGSYGHECVQVMDLQHF